MAISFDKAFGIHQYTLGVRTERAEVIAANIANADTPGYKARDLDFSSALEQAQSRTQSGFALATSDARHIQGGSSSSLSGSIKFRVPNQPDTGDGNSVDVQQERTSYMENGLEYQTSLEFLNSRISGLLKAIKGDQA
jgi:flagellar basal-body rod protein FlgB